MTLGGFHPLGGSGDVFSQMNYWYYFVLGLTAFTLEGRVPHQLSSNPLIQRTDARALYARIVDGALGENRKPVIVKRWGSGGLLMPAVVFLDEINFLDCQHGTQIYRRLRYIL